MPSGYNFDNPTTTTEARVEHIADMMRRCTFKRGETYKQLAKEWDLHPDNVKALSAEASKRVRAELTDPERVTVDVCSVLLKVIEMNMTAVDAEGNLDRKGHRNVIDAAKTWATLVGAAAPTRIEAAVGATLDDIQAAMNAAKKNGEGKG